MKRLFKWIAGVVGVLVVLLVVAAIAVPLLFDPNAHKARIESLVEAETGRKLSIQGNVALSLYPWLGFEVGRVTFGNAPGFDDPVFASVERMEVRVRLLSLIEKRLEMDTVRVEGLHLNLTRRANGASNWDDLAGAGEKPASETRAGAPPIAALAIGGVDLRQANVRFDDAQGGHTITLSNLKLVTGPVSPGRPVQIDAEFDLAGGPPQAGGHVTLATRVVLDIDAQRYAAEGFRLTAAMSRAAIPGGKLNFEAQGDASFDAPAQQIVIRGLDLRSDNLTILEAKGSIALKGDITAGIGAGSIRVNNLELTGDLAGLVPDGRVRFELRGNARADLKTNAVAVPDLALKVQSLSLPGLNGSLEASGAFAGNLDQRRFEFSGLEVVGKAAGPALPLKGEVPFRLTAKLASVDFDTQKAAIDAFTLDVAELKSAGSLAAAALLSKPRFSGNLEVARFNLRELLDSLGQPVPETADPKALTSVSLKANAAGSAAEVSIGPLVLSLDDTRLSGSLAVGLGPSAPVRFDLSLDALDADRYLPPPGRKAAPATPATAAATAVMLPVEALRALNLKGRLRAGKLKVSGLRLEDVDAEISAQRGKIQLSPLKAALYGGRYAGNARLDVGSGTPALSLDERVSGVRLDALLEDLGVDSGNLDFSGAPSDVRLKVNASGDLAGNRYRFKDLTLNASLGGKSFAGGKLRFDLQSDAEIDLDKQTLTADPVQLKFGPMTARGQLALTQFLTEARYTARLEVPAFNARALLTTLGQPVPETADPKALTSVSLKANAAGSAAEVSIDPLVLSLDGATVRGKLGVSNFKAPLPTVRFELQVDKLDADRYLPQAKAKAKAKAGTPGAAATAIPVDTLRALDLDGRLAVAQLKIANLRLSNVELVAKGKAGRLHLSPLNAKLYHGTYTGNITLDATGEKPQVTVNEKLSGIQAGPLLKDLRGRALITGRADGFARLSASGTDTDAMKRTLSGDAGFTFLDGAIEGIDLLNTLCKAFSGLNLTSLRKEDLISGLLQFAAPKTRQSGTNQTEFAELKGTLNFTNGVARNEDLSIKSPLLRIGGKGEVNLASERVDYLATVALVSSCQGQGGQDFQELAGIPVPVRITGPLNNPKYEPQIGAGVMEALSRSRQPATPSVQPAPAPVPQQQVQPQEPKDVLEDAGKKAIGDLLRGIFN